MTLWVSTFCPALRLTGAVQRRHPGLLGPPGALQPQSPHTRRHRGNTAGFLFLVFKVSQHFLSLQIKWVRASARKKAFGSRLRQAKRSACPTRGWVKPRSPAVQVLAAQALSALRGDVVWFFPHFFRPSISPSSAGQIAPDLWHKPVADGNQGNGPAPGTRPPHAPVPLRRGYGCHPVSREAHRSAQGEVGDASVFPIAEEQSRFLCIAYQNLTGQGVSGKRFRLQNLPQIFVCSPGKIPLEFLKLPV